MAARVSQAAALVLTDGAGGKAKVSQVATLVLTKLSTPANVSQLVLLALARRVGKRVFAQIDTGNG